MELVKANSQVILTLFKIKFVSASQPWQHVTVTSASKTQMLVPDDIGREVGVSGFPLCLGDDAIFCEECC